MASTVGNSWSIRRTSGGAGTPDKGHPDACPETCCCLQVLCKAEDEDQYEEEEEEEKSEIETHKICPLQKNDFEQFHLVGVLELPL